MKNRNIILEHDGEKIEVTVQLLKDTYITELTLSTNGQLQDKLQSTPKNGIFGCELTLNGTLNNDVPIKVLLKAHLFMRPKYSIYVDNTLVYSQKGMWGGV